MRLARKLTLALVLGILAVMAAYAYVQTREEVVLFEGDLQRDTRRAEALRAAVRSVWAKEGEARARELVEEIAGVAGQAQVRWVRIDTPSGDPLRPELSPEDLRALSAGEVRQLVHPDREGEMRRFTYVPMAAGEPSVLEVAENLTPQLTFIRMSHLTIALATLVAVAVCGAIAMALGVFFVGRPLQLVRDRARAVGAGDFSGRLQLRQRDEIGELAAEIDAMCDRLAEGQRRLAAETAARIAALEQLRHADRLATVGQLGAGVAHELGTPLNVVALRAKEITSPSTSREEAVRHAHVIDEQCERMTGIIRQLLDFSRRGGGHPVELDARDLVAQTFDLLAATAEQRGVTLVVEPGAGAVPVRADPTRLLQALTNVVLNGVQATAPGGRLTGGVLIRRMCPPGAPERSATDCACIRVTDTGRGIRAEDLPRVFEPFFTTKDVGEGTGLGLAVAHGIVAEHGGWIEVESTLGRGSRFTIVLPSAGAPGVATRAAS